LGAELRLAKMLEFISMWLLLLSNRIFNSQDSEMFVSINGILDVAFTNGLDWRIKI
jgi:hypothetical protein